MVTYSEKKYTDNAPDGRHHNVFNENNPVNDLREIAK